MVASSGSFRLQLNAVLAVAKKDALIYYLKAPVLIFGIVFPVCFFLSFAVGRPIPLDRMVPGMLAMALFFTASAIGPLVTPWERSAKTYERLVTTPASLQAILAGDVLAGTVFGLAFSVLPLALGLLVTDAGVTSIPLLVAGIALGALAFATLGVLLAAPATTSPSQIMMFSAMVRLPLIFISGIFIPLREMPAWGRWAAPLSPLSYCVDLVRAAFGEPTYFPWWLDLAALAAFTVGFFALARMFHGLARR